ncbi:fatty acid CoA ligase family protein [Gemmata sp.]|uniref:fatty acid CoA ligase family protein n=1 Tax=Gemmata sp. TaxID=1914242 RepID=UPI003F7055EB
MTLNVASHLARMAADHPAQVAVHFPRRGVKPEGASEHVAVTFAELNADADAIAHGLVDAGIVRGTRTALMVPPSPDFFALTFALFKVAAVPVLIDPGMGVRNLGRCLADAEPEAFVGIAKAHAARRVLRWGKKTLRTTVNAGWWRFLCDRSLAGLRTFGKSRGPYTIPDVGRDEPAAILFTSGSTGVAKGAEYTHGIFAAQVDALKAVYGIEPGEIDLCTFPLFALFGPALGMTCVIPAMNPTRPAQIDPRKAVAQIRQFGVTNMFGSPAVIRRLGDWASGGREPPESRNVGEDSGGSRPPLATLRRVISAGAPASAASLERFVKLLPDSAQVFTPYGATEALPVANIGSREILAETRHLTDQGKGVCVGRPVPGMEVSVIAISDEPIREWSDALKLPPGEVGEFVVRGPVVTRRYFNRPEATASAKVRDPRTGEVLHRMGDVGYLDDTGRLWFCGRKSHRVVTPHGTLFTDMVEPVFNTVPGVRRTALVGVMRRDGIYPVLCVEMDRTIEAGSRLFDAIGRPRSTILDQLMAGAGARFEHSQRITTFLCHPVFPVDVRHNSKIFREKLAVWADKTLGPNWKPQVPVESPA